MKITFLSHHAIHPKPNQPSQRFQGAYLLEAQYAEAPKKPTRDPAILKNLILALRHQILLHTSMPKKEHAVRTSEQRDFRNDQVGGEACFNVLKQLDPDFTGSRDASAFALGNRTVLLTAQDHRDYQALLAQSPKPEEALVQFAQQIEEKTKQSPKLRLIFQLRENASPTFRVTNITQQSVTEADLKDPVSLSGVLSSIGQSISGHPWLRRFFKQDDNQPAE